MNRALILLLALALTGSARGGATPAETLAYASFVADAWTTREALRDGAREANPLYGSSPSDEALLAGVALRSAAVYWLARTDFRWREEVMLALACLTLGVAGANLRHDAGRPERVQAFTIGVSLPLFGYGVLQ